MGFISYIVNFFLATMWAKAFVEIEEERELQERRDANSLSSAYTQRPENRAGTLIHLKRPVEDLASLLDESPQLLNARDSEGNTILDIIFGFRTTQDCNLVQSYLRCVFDRGIDINLAKAGSYQRGIHKAVLNDNLAALKFMLKKDPGLLHYNLECGGTIIHLAARYGSPEAMSILLDTFVLYYNYERQLDLDNKRRSPLHLAAREERNDIVKLLVIRRVPVWEKDDSGRSALDYAARHENRKIYDLLSKSSRTQSPKPVVRAHCVSR